MNDKLTRYLVKLNYVSDFGVFREFNNKKEALNWLEAEIKATAGSYATLYAINDDSSRDAIYIDSYE